MRVGFCIPILYMVDFVVSDSEDVLLKSAGRSRQYDTRKYMEKLIYVLLGNPTFCFDVSDDISRNIIQVICVVLEFLSGSSEGEPKEISYVKKEL